MAENGKEDSLRDHETDIDDVIYEDEVLEMISLDSEDDQPDIEDDLEDLDIGAADVSGDSEEDEMGVTMFTPISDDAINCFTFHEGPVFTVAIDSASSLLCTGGQDDRAFVWNMNNPSALLFECKGHKESVTCCSFSRDGKYVCTGDLSGLVQVWQTSDGKLTWSFDTSSSIEWILWHFQANVLFCGTGDGEGWVWRIPSGECKTLPSHGRGNTTGVLIPDGKRLCCGYDDGSLKIWDIKSANQITSLANQNSPVTCLACHGNGNTLLIGYMNGASLIVNNNDAKVLAQFSKPDKKRPGAGPVNECSVECVAFTPSVSGQQLALVATVTGSLTAWDLPTQKIRYSVQSESGIVRLIVSQLKPVMYTCHLDGAVREWEVTTGACQRAWHGHCAGILDMGVTKDELHIVTTSDDATARIYSNAAVDHTP